MPFIKPSRRTVISLSGLEGFNKIQPGDRCYVFYKDIVARWKANPGWTIAHEIYKGVISERNSHETYSDEHDDNGCELCDELAAYELAWQVFFQLHVMPYELKKMEENGDI